MKTTIGVYNSHEEAVAIVKKLKDNGFTSRHISILGRFESKEDNTHISTGEPAKVVAEEMGIAAIAGPALGVLTGLGLFAIPGLGFLYGAGALVGAIAGFDFALIGGGLVSALTVAGMKDEHAKEYEKFIREGKYIVVVQGSDAELDKAKKLIEAYGTHNAVRLYAD